MMLTAAISFTDCGPSIGMDMIENKIVNRLFSKKTKKLTRSRSCLIVPSSLEWIRTVPGGPSMADPFNLQVVIAAKVRTIGYRGRMRRAIKRYEKLLSVPYPPMPAEFAL